MRRLPHVRRIVLSSLSACPNHGYGVIGWAASLFPNEPRMSIGSVYGAIEALENDELIELHEERIQQGRKRRVMRITSRGMTVLQAELRLLQREIETSTIVSYPTPFGEVSG